MKDKENQIFDKCGNYDFPTEIKQDELNTATTQIEEMANCKNCVYQKMCIDKISCGVLTANKDGYLKLKCNYYQPKLPEDSVVLSKEEFEKYQNLKRDVEYSFEYNQGYTDGQNKASKETAEKFVNLDKGDILVVDTQEFGEIEVVSLERLQELAKQFGVEVDK